MTAARLKTAAGTSALACLMAVLCTSCQTVPEATQWKRFSTADGVFSSEFPAAPENETPDGAGKNANRLTLARGGGKIQYTLSCSDSAAKLDKPEEQLDALRDAMPDMMASLGPTTFVKEQKLQMRGAAGRELEYLTGNSVSTRTRVYFVGNRIYRATVVAPVANRSTPETEHFLASVQVSEPTNGKP